MIQEIAIQKAITLLNAAKAKYCIQFNGLTYGELQVKEDKKTRTKKYSFVDEYKPVLLSMEIGDSYMWKYPKEQAESFRSSITSCAPTLWGKDSYISTVRINEEGAFIELLRTT